MPFKICILIVFFGVSGLAYGDDIPATPVVQPSQCRIGSHPKNSVNGVSALPDALKDQLVSAGFSIATAQAPLDGDVFITCLNSPTDKSGYPCSAEPSSKNAATSMGFALSGANLEEIKSAISRACLISKHAIGMGLREIPDGECVIDSGNPFIHYGPASPRDLTHFAELGFPVLPKEGFRFPNPSRVLRLSFIEQTYTVWQGSEAIFKYPVRPDGKGVGENAYTDKLRRGFAEAFKRFYLKTPLSCKNDTELNSNSSVLNTNRESGKEVESETTIAIPDSNNASQQ